MDAWPVGLFTGCFHQQNILSGLDFINLLDGSGASPYQAANRKP